MKKTSTVSYDSVCDVYDVFTYFECPLTATILTVFMIFTVVMMTRIKGGGGEGAWFSSAQFFFVSKLSLLSVKMLFLCLDVHRQQRICELECFSFGRTWPSKTKKTNSKNSLKKATAQL